MPAGMSHGEEIRSARYPKSGCTMVETMLAEKMITPAAAYDRWYSEIHRR
jgi:hypothetical protein